MEFIGQRHIMSQLSFILPEVYKNNLPANFLLRGKSGFGKTKLAILICNYLSGLNFYYSTGDRFVFNQKFRVHFIDEAHKIETPESLYPLMDSGKYVFVFAMNENGDLPEAFVNRCENLIFTDYSDEELFEIVREASTMELSEDKLKYIITSCGGNPREILHLVRKLEMLWRNTGVDFGSLENFKSILEQIFGIEDGLDVLARKYIEILSKLGGTAGLNTIKSLMHTDTNTLRYFVEPILLYQNKIKISNRGRSLV